MLRIEEQFIDIGGKKVFVKHIRQTENVGRTLVLLHDSLGCTMLWRDWPELLAEALSCDIIVYDRVGYGESDKMNTIIRTKDYLKQEAIFLDQLLVSLAIEEVALFGHSDGASIALWYGILYSHKTKAIVSEAAHVIVEELTLEGVKASWLAYQTTDLKQRLTKYHGDKVDDLVHAWVDTWLSDWYSDWSMAEDLIAIKSPLLFIQGDLDEYGTLNQLRLTVSQTQGISMSYILEGVGHTPHKESKEEVKQKIVSFLSIYL